jgi:phosphoserine phosphatase
MTSTPSSGAVLVDLDGTLLSSNSFHSWIRYILFSGLRCVPPLHRNVARAGVACLCGLRLVRLISHARLKRGVQLAWARSMHRASDECEQSEIQRFVQSIMRQTNHDVLALVRSLEGRGVTAVLVTAAPSEYATALSNAFGFTQCLATVHGSHPAWEENARDTKRKGVMAALAIGMISRPISLFTDHIDDLPLMREADEVFLVGSIARNREAIADTLGAGTTVQAVGEE